MRESNIGLPAWPNLAILNPPWQAPHSITPCVRPSDVLRDAASPAETVRPSAPRWDRSTFSFYGMRCRDDRAAQIKSGCAMTTAPLFQAFNESDVKATGYKSQLFH
jgi:hypothetical protein